MKGHADYAKRGQDIVCASASAVALFTIKLLKRQVDGLFEKVEPGDLQVMFEPNGATDDIMRTFHLFMKQLADQYPKHIKIFGGIRH